jgi:hypothetical protein
MNKKLLTVDDVMREAREKIESSYEVRLNQDMPGGSHKVTHWYTSANGNLAAETVAFANSREEAEKKRTAIIQSRIDRLT